MRRTASALRRRYWLLPGMSGWCLFAHLIDGPTIGTIVAMASVEKILAQMQREPAKVRFSDLKKLCEKRFGRPRQTGTSLLIFETPWVGDPRINIQDANGKAKVYQVRQVLKKKKKLEGLGNER